MNIVRATWHAISAPIRPLVAPLAKRLERWENQHHAQRNEELAATIAGALPEQAAELRALAIEQRRRAGA